MDLISKAVRDIMNTIPTEILKMAYLESHLSGFGVRTKQNTLEDAIRTKTILSRVIEDTNMVGQLTIVDLTGIVPKNLDENNYIFEIPPERVGFRTIVSVMSINYYRSSVTPGTAFASSPSFMPTVGSDLTLATQKAMDSRGNIPIVSTSECSVVGHNVLMVRNHFRGSALTEARCRVENDETLQNMPMTMSPIFSKLCIYAVKSFIYRTLFIKLDRGAIDRGHEIGAIKQIVDSYSDAEENYITCRQEEWGASAVMADRMMYEDLLKLQLNPAM